jgi:oxaloacetate decarboxylase alpha subunit
MGRRVGLIETTLRDGQQSLWATRMTTAELLPALPILDRAGFETIECMATVVMDACVRYLRENPWERMRLMRERVRRTPLGMMAGVVFSAGSRGILADDLLDLLMRRSVANGMERFFLQDGLGDIRNLEVPVRAVKESGGYVYGGLCYSVSPVHTDEFFASRVGELIRVGSDSIVLKDPNGLLTPERVATLMPALQRAAGDVPIYCHSHCNSGLGPASNLKAVDEGAAGIWTAAAPLANGTSLPATESMARHLRRAGYEVEVDLEAAAEVSRHFERVAQRAGKPVGRPAEYDPFLYEHQMPGGMVSNFRAQLGQLGLADRLQEVLEEIPSVRRDLGWAPMVTPYSQFIATQAAMNVLYGRYQVILDQVEEVVLGYFGRTPAPIEPDVLDRVGRGKQPVTERAGGMKAPVVERVRRELGPFESDDDLLLAAFFRPEVLRALEAAGPIPLEAEGPAASGSSLVELVREVARGGKVRHFSLVVRG